MWTSLCAVILALIAFLLISTEWISAQVVALHPPSGLFMPFDGGRLHVVDRAAAGPEEGAVLLMHGASSNHADLLETLGPHLKDRYRVIAPDRPGLGWSDRIGGSAMAKPEAQADLMINLIERLETGPVVLVAHSLAGALSLDMALKRPDLIKSVVLLGAVTHPWPGGIAWYYHLTVKPWIGGAFMRLVTIPFGYLFLDKAMASVFAPSPEPAGYLDTAKIRLLFRPDSFRANAEDVSALFDAVTRLSPRYGELQMPVVAFHGTGDTVSFASLHSEPMPKAAPKGRYVPLPGVGHMAHHAAPEKIVGVIDELAGVVSRIGASR